MKNPLDRELLGKNFWELYKKNLKRSSSIIANNHNNFLALCDEKDAFDEELWKIADSGEREKKRESWNIEYLQKERDMDIAEKSSYRNLYILTVADLIPQILSSSIRLDKSILAKPISMKLSFQDLEFGPARETLLATLKRKFFKELWDSLSIHGNYHIKDNFSVCSSSSDPVTVEFLGFDKAYFLLDADKEIAKVGRWLWPEEMLFLMDAYPELALVCSYPTLAHVYTSNTVDENRELVMCAQLMPHVTESNLFESYQGKEDHRLALFPKKRMWSNLCVFPYVPYETIV